MGTANKSETITTEYTTDNQALLDAGFEAALEAVKESQKKERQSHDAAVEAIDVTYVYVSKVKGTPQLEAECKAVGCSVRLPDAVRNPYLKPNKLIRGECKVRKEKGVTKTWFVDLDRFNTSKRALIHHFMAEEGVPAEPGEATAFIKDEERGGGTISACVAKARQYFSEAPAVQDQIAEIIKRIGDIGVEVDQAVNETMPDYGLVPCAVVNGKLVVASDFVTDGNADFLRKTSDIEPDLGVLARFYRAAEGGGDAELVYGHNDSQKGRTGCLIEQSTPFGTLYIRSETQLELPKIQFKLTWGTLFEFQKIWKYFPWHDHKWMIGSNGQVMATLSRNRVNHIRKRVEADFKVPEIFKPVSGSDDEYLWPLETGFPQHEEKVDEIYVNVDHSHDTVTPVPADFIETLSRWYDEAEWNPADRLRCADNAFHYIQGEEEKKICDGPVVTEAVEVNASAEIFHRAFGAINRMSKRGTLRMAIRTDRWTLFKHYAGLEFGVVISDRKEG